ncbi:alpha/beta fold hydrolase [Actinoplanes sp. NPDC051851]|uniref:alpha/beta hydrolase family protein n=1 Tax=Actinoplanes sp. NPDC051851 TaxID=3154753 RepID=UPI0034198896
MTELALFFGYPLDLIWRAGLRRYEGTGSWGTLLRMRNYSSVTYADVTVPVPAGGTVTAALFQPLGAPVAVLVIHSATATPQGFYRALAEHLAEHGIATVTYDYRGTGRSGDPRAFAGLGVRDWIAQDAPAVAAWAHRRFPDLPHFALGHSLGGHVIALGEAGDHLTGAVIVASHLAAIRRIPSVMERVRVQLLFSVLGPAAVRLFGYVPARRLGLGEDIPSGAFAEWAGWARRDQYFADDPSMRTAERFIRVTQPVLAIGFTDDPWSTPEQIDALTARLTGATVERRTYTPADAGVARIGHHGFLRREVGESLWPDLVAWLSAYANKEA